MVKGNFTKFYTFVKVAWLIASAIPTIISVIGIVAFGVSLDNDVLAPLTKPFVTCRNEDLNDPEDGYIKYKTTVTVTRPLYLRVTQNYFSYPYQLNIVGTNNFTIYNFGDLKNSDGLELVERRFSSEKHIAKSIHFSHRFIQKTEYEFSLILSGPTKLKPEGECPFSYSASY